MSRCLRRELDMLRRALDIKRVIIRRNPFPALPLTP